MIGQLLAGQLLAGQMPGREIMGHNHEDKFSKYVYLDFLYHHWEDISHMVEENYSKYLKPNDSLIIGACSKHTVSEMRETYDADRFIVYQLEPLYEDHWHPVSNILSNMEGADEVWDYDVDNIKLLKSHGINAKFRPFLYTEKLNRVPKLRVDQLDIDLLFYGSLTKERLDIIFDIYCTCGMSYNIVVLWNVDGAKLDGFISRAKVIVDLQTNSSENIQKQTRIYYALSNNKCIVSEKSRRNYYGDFIIESERHNMAETLLDILNNRSWEQKMELIDGKFKEFSQKFVGGMS